MFLDLGLDFFKFINNGLNNKNIPQKNKLHREISRDEKIVYSFYMFVYRFYRYKLFCR